MTDGSPDTALSERTAGLLADAWQQAWQDFGDAGSAIADSDQLLHRARELLSFVITCTSAPSDDPYLGFAVFVLQDIGEGYALVSEASRAADVANLSMPNRRMLEEFITTTELDAWCGAYGHQLELITAAQQPTTTPTAALPADLSLGREHEAYLARHVAMTLAGYPKFYAFAQDDRGRAEIFRRRDQLRDDYRAALSACRAEFDLLGALPDRGGAARRAVLLTRLLTVSRFLATTLDPNDPDDRVSMLPPETLALGAASMGVNDWIDRYTADGQ